MDESKLIPTLEAIEKHLAKLENKPKDWLDKLNSLASILVPASIALAGHLIGQAISNAQIASAEKQATQNYLVAQSNVRIAQAQLINTFMRSLTSNSSNEQKIAIQAILIALPEQGPSIVRGVALYEKNTEVQQVARVSLDQRQTSLIRGIFSDDANIRQNSTQDLIQGWQSDPKIVTNLIQYAEQNFSNENGVYNTVVVLNALNTSLLVSHREAVVNFLQRAKGIGPKTARIAEQVKARL